MEMDLFVLTEFEALKNMYGKRGTRPKTWGNLGARKQTDVGGKAISVYDRQEKLIQKGQRQAKQRYA